MRRRFFLVYCGPSHDDATGHRQSTASVEYFEIDIGKAIVEGNGPPLEWTNFLNTGYPIF